ncbi:nucleotidyltransferase family protein [Acidimicrobiia bacterium EGI L10123]|uniref:nucleotidyltransferase family protein n=1 Tax=Salinilacustrithrix flava TaxID=2957203 RepID=UPI003D7C23B5|nr:nucleotidyltransferase family protein [Acidimicrobiia bacterium EGI L10123]
MDPTTALQGCCRWAVGAQPVPGLEALPDDEWHRLVREARTERLIGLLAAAVGECTDLSDERREQVSVIESEWALHTLRAERAMLEAVDLLDRAGIPQRVLKGSVFAHAYWPAPHLRVFADADVLVPSEAMDDAVAAVIAGGGTRILPQVRPGFDRRFGKSVTLRNADGIEIDLHRTLVAGPHTFLVPEADLWVEPSTVEVAGRQIPVFPPPLQLVHAAAHVVASVVPRASSVLDLAFTGSRADLDQAAEVATRWKLRAVVRDAGARLGRLLGADGGEVAAWATALEPSAEEEHLLTLFTGQRSFRRSALAAVPYIPRRRDKARFLGSLAFPSKAHRRAR